MNTAEKTLKWVNDRLSEGHTVYFATSYRSIKVDDKAVKRWAKTGNQLLRVTKSGLRVGNDLVATPSQVLVKIHAN